MLALFSIIFEFLIEYMYFGLFLLLTAMQYLLVAVLLKIEQKLIMLPMLNSSLSLGRQPSAQSLPALLLDILTDLTLYYRAK